MGAACTNCVDSKQDKESQITTGVNFNKMNDQEINNPQMMEYNNIIQSAKAGYDVNDHQAVAGKINYK